MDAGIAAELHPPFRRIRETVLRKILGELPVAHRSQHESKNPRPVNPRDFGKVLHIAVPGMTNAILKPAVVPSQTRPNLLLMHELATAQGEMSGE
jgi:hypothetical protein